MEWPNIGIVYLSYNGISYFKEVFSALEALDYPKDRLKLIFVDNNSSDGSVDYLRTVQGITLIANKENFGFALGNNIGIEQAIAQGCSYVYLHNNDLKLDPHAIKEAVMLAESDPTIGSVQSLIKLWKHPDTINSTGNMIHYLGFGFARDNGRKDADVQVEQGEEIAYASGAAVLYRVSALERSGFLDPYLFLYHEDLQLGWRLRLLGYKNVLSTTSVAYHDYSFKKSSSKFYWMERNRWLVHLSYLRVRTLLLLVPLMLMLEPFLCVFAWKGGWFHEKMRVYAQFFRMQTWHYLFVTRKEIQSMRQTSDAHIVSLFTSQILHQETEHWLVTQIGNPFLSVIWSVLKPLIRW